MVRCKNVGGGLSDGDESPPRVTEVARGKHKKLAVKKRKRTSTEQRLHRPSLMLQSVQRGVAEAVGFTLVSVAFILMVSSSVLRPQRPHWSASHLPT
jgi:hypothetical protein